MKKQKIVRVQEDGGDGSYLTYDDKYLDRSTIRPTGRPTAEEYAELCDQDAEDRNAHDFCGTHNGLLELLTRNKFRDVRLIMKKIAEHGGLQQIDDE